MMMIIRMVSAEAVRKGNIIIKNHSSFGVSLASDGGDKMIEALLEHSVRDGNIIQDMSTLQQLYIPGDSFKHILLACSQVLRHLNAPDVDTH